MIKHWLLKFHVLGSQMNHFNCLVLKISICNGAENWLSTHSVVTCLKEARGADGRAEDGAQ